MGLIILLLLLPGLLFTSSEAPPFSVGEKLQYAIYAAGFPIGKQTIELEEMVEHFGTSAYKLTGLSKTSPFVSIFYRLDDRWLVLIDKETVFPMRIEKDMVEGKKEGYFIYEINNSLGTVDIHDVTGQTVRTVQSENTVFDLFTLLYYYRSNPDKFNDTFTFDFLEPKRVRTVQFRNEGQLTLEIPKISKQTPIQALKLTQVGGVGIEIYVGADELRLPLKMVVPSRLPRDKRVLIEFYLDRYSPGRMQNDIPEQYRKLRF